MSSTISISSAEAAAKAAFDGIKRRSEYGRAGRLWPNEPAFREEFINDEWLYLDVFIFDYSIYRTFGNTQERQLVLTQFQKIIMGWLGDRIVSKIPDVRQWAFDPGEEPMCFPPEIAERAVTRLTRRVESYAKALALHSELGENLSVGSVFAAHCGASAPEYIVSVSRYFFDEKTNYIKMLKLILPIADGESTPEISQLKSEREGKEQKIDLGISIDGVRLPKVGQIIDPETIDDAGLRIPGLLGRMMMSKQKTAPDDKIFFKKNCFIQCKKFGSQEDFGITENTEIGNGPMWGNSIALFVSCDGLLKKVLFQIIMNRAIAEVNLQEFRRLCVKTFGPPEIATDEVHVWRDEYTSVVSARNGGDAVFEWFLI